MKRSGRFPPAVIFLILVLVYGMTLAPGLTWSHHGADGGDLITAAAVNGIPHPTGYPTYLLLARLFQFLPIGSLAFRANLLSALFAALAALFAYKLVTRETNAPLAGSISALAFGLSPLLWSQAVVAEVYALHAFFAALLLFLTADNAGRHPAPQITDIALGLTFGLALGNHLTTIFFLPMVFAPALRPFRVSFLLRRLAWMGAGLLVYLTLPLRALANPPVNWGNPVTLKNFLWLATARLYQDEVFALSLPALWTRIQSAAALLLDQFGFVGLVLSLIGLIFRPTSLHRHTIWIAAAFSVFALGYFTEDSYLYFIPPILSFAVWLGLGVDGLMKTIEMKPPSPPSSQRHLIFFRVLRGNKIAFAFGLAVLLYLLSLAAIRFPRMDASRDARAEQFGQLVMAQMPENTIVFADGDQAIFDLWYFHYALHQRPDLVVIAADLLHFDWYQQTLKSNYPSLVVNGPFPFPATIIADNPNRPACFVEYDGQAIIRCNP